MKYLFNSPHFNYRLIDDTDSHEFITIYTNEHLMQHISDPISVQAAMSLFNQFLQFNLVQPQNHYLFSVIDNVTQKLTGFCGVNTVENNKQSLIKTGEIGVMLPEKSIGKGIGTEILTALVSCCFHNMGYKKLIGPPSPNNIASIRMLEKAGFEKETILKRHLTIKGEQLDTPLYVIYNTDERVT